MVDEELMNCPFCAAIPDIEFSHEAGQWDVYEIECPCGISVYGPCGHEGEAAKNAAIRKWNTRAPLQGADTVTEAQVKAALDAIVPGGARVWHWLPTDKGGQKPHRTARNVMRCALEAAMRTAAPTAQDDTGARLDADWKQLQDDLATGRGGQSPVDGPHE